MFIAVALASLAAVPTYDDFQLQARSNFTVNGPAFNLPGDAFFTNSTIAINDLLQVAFRLEILPDTGAHGIWFGGLGFGEIVYTTPGSETPLTGQVALNNAGTMVMPQSFVSPSGIVQVNGFTFDAEIAVGAGGPFGITGWEAPKINERGQIGFRATLAGSGRAYVSTDIGGEQVLHVADVAADPKSPYSFLFTPDFNAARQMAGVLRLGGVGETGNDRPDEIRVFDVDGNSVLIAQDIDADPASPFASFHNGIALGDDGRVAFSAQLVAGGSGVFLGDGATIIEIAREGDEGVGAIEFFAPDLNDKGMVAFRAFDEEGLRAIFVGDGSSLSVVVREHDILPSDLGPARVDQNDDGSPVFGGGVSINAFGDVAFNCGLTPPDDDQIEWGSGAYVAVGTPNRSVFGDLNGDGIVDGADLGIMLGAWGTGDPLADLDGNGAVDGADLGLLLGAWG